MFRQPPPINGIQPPKITFHAKPKAPTEVSDVKKLPSSPVGTVDTASTAMTPSIDGEDFDFDELFDTNPANRPICLDAAEDDEVESDNYPATQIQASLAAKKPPSGVFFAKPKNESVSLVGAPVNGGTNAQFGSKAKLVGA